MFSSLFKKKKTRKLEIQFRIYGRWLTYGVTTLDEGEINEGLFSWLSRENTMRLPTKVLDGDDVIYLEHMTFPNNL
jgi:hypothetical protein